MTPVTSSPPVHLQLAAAIDEAMPRLNAIDEAASLRKPTPEAWCARQILGHLVDSAANNHQRFVRVQVAGRLEFPSYQQMEWVAAQDYESVPWKQLVAFWEAYNRHLVHVLSRVDPEAWQCEIVFPGKDPLTLAFVARDYIRHLLQHLAQVLSRAA